jgi:hypothetical protein
VVRYFRHPGIPDDHVCPECGQVYFIHGFIGLRWGKPATALAPEQPKASVLPVILILAALSCFLARPTSAADRYDGFTHLFGPVPTSEYGAPTHAALRMALATSAVPDSSTVTGIWAWKPVFTFPEFSFTESAVPGRLVDFHLFQSAGGGLTFERTVLRDGKNYATFSASGIVLLSGNTDSKTPIDCGLALTVDCLDHLVGIGAGVNLGNKVPGVSRFMALASFQLVPGQN